MLPQGRDETWQIPEAADPAKSLLRTPHDHRYPPHDHRAIPPSVDVAREAADRAVQVLHGVGGGKGAIQRPTDTEALKRQRFIEPLTE